MDKEEVFNCPNCGNRTSHILAKEHIVNVPDIDDPEMKEIMTFMYYYFFQCKTCNGICLKGIFYSEFFDDFKPDFDIVETLYPSSNLNNKEIPNGLKTFMDEVNKVKVVSKFAYIFMVRKVLEEMCKDKGIKGRTLKENLNKLVKQEHLPEVFIKASENLRLLGNIGVHQSKINIDKEDTNLIEEFLISLIEYVYILPTKLEKLELALNKQKEAIQN